MNAVELSSIDLNLLVALDALLSEGSVTRAARRVGVGQSAMSHSLRRLREVVGDPLLVRSGRGMAPTPRAEALAGPLRRTLGELSRLLGDGGRFDPATSSRTFRLICPDLLAAFLPQLLARLEGEAPGVTLEVLAPTAGPVAGLALADADLALAAAQSDATGCVQRAVGSLRWVVLGRRGHPAFRRFTVAAWLRYPHVVIKTGSGSRSAIGAAIAAAGHQRKVGLVVPGFLSAPFAVARTDMLFAAPSPLVDSIARLLDLVTRAPPIAIPEVRVVALWSERLAADPGHRWFRDLVADVVASALR